MFISVRNDHHGRQHRHHSNHLKPLLRDRHIVRLKQGACSVEAGFVWSDLLTDLERTSDHCSNIALSILDACGHNMNAHQSLRILKRTAPVTWISWMSIPENILFLRMRTVYLNQTYISFGVPCSVLPNKIYSNDKILN